MTTDTTLQHLADSSDVSYEELSQIIASAYRAAALSSPILRDLNETTYTIPQGYMSWKNIRSYFLHGYLTCGIIHRLGQQCLKGDDLVKLEVELHAQTVPAAVARTAAQEGFPFSLIGKGFCEHIRDFDVGEKLNIYTEAAMLGGGGYFVPPTGALKLSDDEHVTLIGCAHLDAGCSVGEGFEDETDKETARLFIVVYTDTGNCYPTRIPVSDEGFIKWATGDRMQDSAVDWALRLMVSLAKYPSLIIPGGLRKRRKAKKGRKSMSFMTPFWVGRHWKEAADTPHNKD